MSGKLRSNPLRQEAERIMGCPVRLDRGEDLYLCMPPVSYPLSELFQLTLRDQRLRMRPTAQGLAAFEIWAMQRIHNDTFGTELLGFQGAQVSELESELFIQGVKHMELNAPTMLWLHYDKRIRQMAADCLRKGEGGGALHACWAAMTLGIQGGKVK
ncbi:hypothetical protein LJC33_04100 [Eubacteriales bacterium OttesenSCG-928-N13]|nr:hypothetical protein [Eubacteriales bacterium OttesenSCG-928-N13]